jgi:hypothetical protein
MQEPQPLGRHLPNEKVDTRGITAGLGEACHYTKLDRVFANTKDNRDSRGRSFGREGRRRGGGRGNHGDTPADQVSHQPRQAIPVALQPVVLDRYILAFDVAGFD